MGVARRAFLDTMEALRDIMSGLARANADERGTLDWGKVFSFACHPRIAGECRRPWGIEPAGYYCHPLEQGGPSGSAQKATQELLLKYMELDVDLAVFTTKKVVKWYDELLSLCKVAVQSQGVEGRVDKAVTLAKQLQVASERRTAAPDRMSVTSESASEKTLCGEKDWGLGKVTVVEIEDVRDSARYEDREELAQPRKARWWRRVLASFVTKVRASNRQRQQDEASKLVRRSLEISRTRTELSKSVVECKHRPEFHLRSYRGN
ncbi:hypothetical protein COL5a_008105 [Colletotrichum fioriniae]|nr:hypothetical protein COL5a_008105 [Colletotrichum fioriniae]